MTRGIDPTRIAIMSAQPWLPRAHTANQSSLASTSRTWRSRAMPVRLPIGHQLVVAESTAEALADGHGLAVQTKAATVVDPRVFRHSQPHRHERDAVLCQLPPARPTTVITALGLLDDQTPIPRLGRVAAHPCYGREVDPLVGSAGTVELDQRDRHLGVQLAPVDLRELCAARAAVPVVD